MASQSNFLVHTTGSCSLPNAVLAPRLACACAHCTVSREVRRAQLLETPRRPMAQTPTSTTHDASKDAPPPAAPVATPSSVRPQVQAMLDWISNSQPAEMVERLRVDGTEAVTALTKDVAALLGDSYVETDEDVGPRISAFSLREKQLASIGQQMTVMRDSASAVQAAHVQLAELATMDESKARTLACVRALSDAQEGSAQATQQLATHYDRFVSVALNQLQGAATVVQEKYSAYCHKVVEIRRRKAQLQARRSPELATVLAPSSPPPPHLDPSAVHAGAGAGEAKGAGGAAQPRADADPDGCGELHHRHGGPPGRQECDHAPLVVGLRAARHEAQGAAAAQPKGRRAVGREQGGRPH